MAILAIYLMSEILLFLPFFPTEIITDMYPGSLRAPPVMHFVMAVIAEMHSNSNANGGGVCNVFIITFSDLCSILMFSFSFQKSVRGMPLSQES